MKRAIIVLLITAAVLLAFRGGWFYALRDEGKDNLNPPGSNTQDVDATTETEDSQTFYTSDKGVRVEVVRPTSNSTISSPLTISGSVPGSWSFEASFPVVLLDANRKVIAQEPATLNGNWMTEELVPFTATLNFPDVTTPTGFLVLQKDNASGMPENDDSVEIPIKFE